MRAHGQKFITNVVINNNEVKSFKANPVPVAPRKAIFFGLFSSNYG